ncbi:Complement C4 [Triplophysa tibetana]|uniref:Complement C4 n=1 Tax=Triplophysa tibetana TaxID=1572043 RepID=A0A5A9MZ49_9TELE|nr:Complement C4 [Triplophysa tibetana]
MVSPLVYIVFVFLAVDAKTPTCLIVSPNIIHLGVDETVSVQLHGATKSTSMNLYFKHQIMENPVSIKKSVILNEDNQYQAVVKLQVDRRLFESIRKDPYVQLVAESEDIFGKGPRMVNIFVSRKRGFIFIQTDKPIYNPGEIVRYRIFTLNHVMLPMNDTILVKITNSKGLIVYNHMMGSQEIMEKSITIPDMEEAGHWKILVSFENSAKPETTSEFEVREYVLPSFEVKIETTQPYHTLKSTSFPFNISARYTYGKGVNGVAYVRFGLLDEKGNRTYLPGTEKQTEVIDGTAQTEILTVELSKASERSDIRFMEGYYLSIAVSVLEKTSGNLEEAESSSVKIVTSPYVIDLSKTKQHFTPGGVFSVVATATYPNGNRAPYLKFKATVQVTTQGSTEQILNEEGLGNYMGDIAMSFQIPTLAKTLFITVFAEGSEQEVILSDKKMTVNAVEDVEGRYLSLEVEHQILQPGQDLKTTLRDITPPNAARPPFFYLLVLSKGRIVQVVRVQRTEITTTNVRFTEDLVPAFRLIAYYFTDIPNRQKIVADSVWVDVKDVCKGKVEILSLDTMKPAKQFELLVKTDPNSRVALAAVDSAVYILNKNKLSPQKMFEDMNSYDLACSVGGGEDSSAVLQGAGLTFLCNCDLASPIPTEHKCFAKHRNRRGAVDRIAEYNALVNSYKNQERRCCFDGTRPSKVLQTCNDRVRNVKHSASCRAAFEKCCKAAEERRKKDRLQRLKNSLGRAIASDNALDESMVNVDDIHLRSYFPQSWMWTIVESDNSGTVRHRAVAPDSITTWEVQAVGISPTKGFCIAEPKPLRVFQDFFVSVILPYSVKRNEQLQVKAVVYNYKPDSLQIKVKMDKADGLCSVGGNDVETLVTVPGNSALAVYFTVVPLVIGNIPITVLAYGSPTARDRVQKQLRVEEEGQIVFIDKEFNIYPNARKLEIDIPTPADKIPNGQDSISVGFKGGMMGESVDNCLHLEGVNRLIQLPKGCAEQTMAKMSPAIHAMRYLDDTNQWISLQAERRDEAKSMIQTGYNTVLSFKKTDGSYGAFLWKPSSIWLTAFIAKELTQARDIIQVEDSYIREAMSYLISKQKNNGAWDDPNALYDRRMKGGVGQAQDDVALAAFVLLSMHRAVKVYELGTDTELRMSMEKAKSYLEEKVDVLQNLYSVAITAYVMSLYRPLTPGAQRAQEKLKDKAKCAKSKCFWNAKGGKSEGQADAEAVETTAYGLLNALSVRDKEMAKEIANWLTEQRGYGGGFRSTQDTVVALEALAKYSAQNNDVEDLNLRVEMCHKNGKREGIHLTQQNALTQAAIEFKNPGKMTVKVEGTGRGTLLISQTYRSMKNDESYCDLLYLTVKVKGEFEYKTEENEELFDDDYNYDTNEDLHRDEPRSSMEWFDLRSRRRRQASEEPRKESSFIYIVCVGVKMNSSVGMILVDISLLSGLRPNTGDLEQLMKGSEQYIDRYDVYQNKVFLYFAKIDEAERCFWFGADLIVPMGLVQPAAAVVYDYYNPERRCGIFYTAPQKSPMISKLCNGDVCTCAEGDCPKLRVTFSKNIKQDTRIGFACYSPVTDYVYVIKFVNSSKDGVFIYYTAVISEVLQMGKDSAIRKDATRQIVVRSACGFTLKTEASYLLMGHDEDIYLLNNAGLQYMYILDGNIWIEEIPEEKRCKGNKSSSACSLLKEFMRQHPLRRCDI